MLGIGFDFPNAALILIKEHFLNMVLGEISVELVSVMVEGTFIFFSNCCLFRFSYSKDI